MVLVEEDWYDDKGCGVGVGVEGRLCGCHHSWYGGEAPGRNDHRLDGADRNEHGGEGASVTGCDSSALEENSAVRCFHDHVDVLVLVGCGSCSAENNVVPLDRVRGNSAVLGIRIALGAHRCCNLIVAGGESDTVAAVADVAGLPRVRTGTLEREGYVPCG